MVTLDVVLGANLNSARPTGLSPLVVFIPVALMLRPVMRHLVR